MIKSKYETLSRKQMQKVQLKRLQKTAKKVYKNVPFYKERFKALGVKPKDIKSLKDIQKLPFTTKQDLRNNYPFGLLAVNRDEIVRIHSSSGTTGKPTVAAYTQNDLDMWADALGRIFVMGGANKKDMMHNMTGYGLFTGGLGFDEAAKRLGVGVVPSSTGFTSRQLMLMKDFGATLLGSTTSFVLHLAEVAKEEGYDLKKDFNIRAAFFGAESSSWELKDEISRLWGMKCFDIYGLTEMIGPGVAGNCEGSRLLHINEDLFYPEIINPKTGEVLPIGEKGELVITTLKKEAMPLIRYRTGDITSLDDSKCKCGRTNIKMTNVSGRSDDMLVINGVNIFPSQIEFAITSTEHVSLNYQIIADKKGHLDKLEIDVEIDQDHVTDDMRVLEKIKSDLEAALHQHLYIKADVRLLEPKSIPRSMGKAVRIIDKRS